MGSTRLRRHLSILFWDSDSIAPSRRFEIIVFLKFSFWDSGDTIDPQHHNDMLDAFQFSFWDSAGHSKPRRKNGYLRLSILFLRFMKIIGPRYQGWWHIAFNSLFEILRDRRNRHVSLYPHLFQFSFWDSARDELHEHTAEVQGLSILFLRF